MAFRDRSTQKQVSLLPVPAITGTRPLTLSMMKAMTFKCSSELIVAASPVVPQAIIASAPPLIWSSISFSSSSQRTSPRESKGVTRAVPTPVKTVCFIYGFLPISK